MREFYTPLMMGKTMDKSIWTSLKEAFGRSIKFLVVVWILGALGFVGFIFNIFPEWELSPLVWLFLILLGTAIAPFYSFHKIRIERDEAKRKLDFVEKRNKALSRIAKARTEGVALRIECQKYLIGDKTERTFDEWVLAFREWEDEARKAVKYLQPSEGEIFRTLDEFDDKFKGTTPTEEKWYINMLVHETNELKEIHTRYSPVQKSRGEVGQN